MLIFEKVFSYLARARNLAADFVVSVEVSRSIFLRERTKERMTIPKNVVLFHEFSIFGRLASTWLRVCLPRAWVIAQNMNLKS